LDTVDEVKYTDIVEFNKEIENINNTLKELTSDTSTKEEKLLLENELEAVKKAKEDFLNKKQEDKIELISKKEELELSKDLSIEVAEILPQIDWALLFDKEAMANIA